jgi:DNA-binding transcriptional regulator YdaS (Cro superfamily)
MTIESLQKAVGIMGGQSATARALSTSERKLAQANIWNWLNSKNPDQMPPAEYCPAIERATGGLVRCEDLRPDVDWAVLRGGAMAEPMTELDAA